MAKKMATKRSDDELREILRSVPQKIVGQMFGGRQTVHLQRMANRWGFPIDGKTVDLFAVMTRLWTFLTQYGQQLAALMEDAVDEGDENALGVRYLRAKTAKTEAEAKMVQLRFEERDGSVCPREMMHDLLAPLANRIRAAGEQAQRNWGEDGFDLFHQLELATREALEALKAKEQQSKPDAVKAGSTKAKRSSRPRRGASKAKATRSERSRRSASK